MPRSPGRECPGVGIRRGACRTIIFGSTEYCDECDALMAKKRAEHEKVRNKRPGRAFLRSHSWSKIRKLKLNEDPLCERCFAEGRVVAAVLVHHKDHDELNNSPGNHESLCGPCHTQEHLSKGRTRHSDD